MSLLLYPDSTLLSLPLLLTQSSFRQKVISKVDDPVLRQFWVNEFEKMPPNMMAEAVNPILNKV
jgi:hypothetical protein